MGNKEEPHVTIESYREKIDIWYRANNIIREKTELYYDFISALIKLIDETYLGTDVMQSHEDITNHFNWCLNRIITDFEQERIYFVNKNGNYDYLWYFIYKGYYTSPHEQKYEHLSEYFRILFSYNEIKPPIELDAFIEFYKLLDQNLKKIN